MVVNRRMTAARRGSFGSLWSAPVTGGPSRRLVRLDDRDRTGGGNQSFSIVAGEVHTRMTTHASSIGLATPRPR